MRLLIAAALLLALAGCAPAPTQDAGARTITVDGQPRTYRLHRPAALPPGPVRLVVMLHGGFGSGAQAEADYGWDAEADREHFVVAYPDGLNRAWAVGGGCCGTPGRTGVDDVAFVTAMVAAVAREVPVDPARVYATGISNGGIFAYRLACDTAALFAAIGPDAATLLGGCPSPAPVSVIHVHGLDDHNIRFDGGPGDGVATIDGPPVPEVVAMWRGVDRCAAPVAATQAAVTTQTATCPDGRAVELVTVAGAGHQWPGAAPKRAGRLLGLDPPSTALDATDTIWRFFAAHGRR